MAFDIPSRRDLVDRTRRAFRDEIDTADPWISLNLFNVFATVFAGSLHNLFLRLDWVMRQAFVATASGRWLDMHADEMGLARRASSPSSGVLVLTSTGAVSVAVGASFTRAGVTYLATATVALPLAGQIEVPVASSMDGAVTTAIAGAPLLVASGVTGDVASVVVGADGLTGGADLEDDEALRARVLFRKRNPPHGGAPADYVMWALEMTGVTRVFVERRHRGAGSVRVFPLYDLTRANGLPLPADITAMQSHLEALAPAGVIVEAAAATAHPVDIVISGLSPATADTREAVLESLRSMFAARSRVSGSDTGHSAMPYLAAPASFSRSWIWQAIADASGEDRHALVSPSADIALVTGEIATLGSVTFV